MSDFPSLQDLSHDETGKQNSTVSSSRMQTSSREAKEVFNKKMIDIKRKQLEDQAITLGKQLHIPHINLEKFPISNEALRQIPFEDAERLGIVCFYVTQDEVRVGALDPHNEEVEKIFQDTKSRNHADGVLYVISANSFEHVLKLYGTLPTIKPITKDIEIKSEDLEKVQADIKDFHSLQTLLDAGSTSDIVTVILGAGLKVDASDVHIEAEETRIIVRFRLDGILQDVATLSKESFKRLVSRIKLFSSLKINVIDKPQDGRFTIKLPSGEVDVRVSTIPTVFGESIVLRLLAQNASGITLEQLGLRSRAFDILKREIERPNGMIITTGPTGSGKSTTLYAILKILNKPGVKIITLEDPVEYRVEGINQSQIDQSKDYTFAKGLRSLLRQDPDIVMVGEIRDIETAEIAVQASLTGHLMLSTLHTNNAIGAIPRFLSMGVKPFLLAPALNCVIGQRLVRRLCETCRKKVSIEELDVHVRERVVKALDELPAAEKSEIDLTHLNFYKPEGCDACNGIGYKGRIGIYEIFTVREDMEQSILSGGISEYDIARLAHEQGMITMLQDGVLKTLDGITTLEEVFRVTE